MSQSLEKISYMRKGKRITYYRKKKSCSRGESKISYRRKGRKISYCRSKSRSRSHSKSRSDLDDDSSECSRGESRISYQRNGRKISYCRSKSRSKNRSRSRSRKKSCSRGERRISYRRDGKKITYCRSIKKITPGTRGWPSLTEEDILKTKESRGQIVHTVGDETRYLRYYPRDHEFYWVEPDNVVLPRGLDTDTKNLFISYLLLKNQDDTGRIPSSIWGNDREYELISPGNKQVNTSSATNVAELTGDERISSSSSANAELSQMMNNLTTSRAIGVCVTEIKGQNNIRDIHTFVWKGRMLQECQNVLIFGITENSIDRRTYYQSNFGKRVCQILYQNRQVSPDKKAKIILSLFQSRDYQPTGATSIGIVYKIGEEDVDLYIFNLKGHPNALVYGVKESENRKLRSITGDMGNNYQIFSTNQVNKGDQIHVIMASSAFMKSTERGFVTWFLSGRKNLLDSADKINPMVCQDLASQIAISQPNENISIIYLILDGSRQSLFNGIFTQLFSQESTVPSEEVSIVDRIVSTAQPMIQNVNESVNQLISTTMDQLPRVDNNNDRRILEDSRILEVDPLQASVASQDAELI